LDKASARSELAASRLEDQMDEVLERSVQRREGDNHSLW